MTTTLIPELPEGDVYTPAFNEAWTAEQMRAFYLQGVEDGVLMERERAARIALDEKVEGAIIDGKLCEGDEAYNLACDHIAAAIRKG